MSAADYTAPLPEAVSHTFLEYTSKQTVIGCLVSVRQTLGGGVLCGALRQAFFLLSGLDAPFPTPFGLSSASMFAIAQVPTRTLPTTAESRHKSLTPLHQCMCRPNTDRLGRPILVHAHIAVGTLPVRYIRLGLWKPICRKSPTAFFCEISPANMAQNGSIMDEQVIDRSARNFLEAGDGK